MKLFRKYPGAALAFALLIVGVVFAQFTPPSGGNSGGTITINSVSCTTGSSCTVPASPNTVTVNGTVCTLGSSCTPSGGGNTISMAAFGSRAVSGTTAGDMFRATDGPITSFWTGAAWRDFAYSMPVTLPTTSTFGTAFGVTSSTMVGTQGGIRMTEADNNNNVLGWVKAIPTNTGTFLFNLTGNNSNDFQSGIGFRESATGKLLVAVLNPSSNLPNILVQRWTSPTAFSSTPTNPVAILSMQGPMLALRLRQAGASIFIDYSGDGGTTWNQVYSEGKAAFFTTAPDQVGPMMIRTGDVEWLFSYSET